MPMHRDTAREKVVNTGAKIKSQVKVVSYCTFMFERGMEKLKLNEHEGCGTVIAVCELQLCYAAL